jgi:hypothetical protein
MIENEFETKICVECGQPLFLTKEECRDFVKNKMKKGFFVCRCCGVKQSSDNTKK